MSSHLACGGSPWFVICSRTPTNNVLLNTAAPHGPKGPAQPTGPFLGFLNRSGQWVLSPTSLEMSSLPRSPSLPPCPPPASGCSAFVFSNLIASLPQLPTLPRAPSASHPLLGPRALSRRAGASYSSPGCPECSAGARVPATALGEHGELTLGLSPRAWHTVPCLGGGTLCPSTVGPTFLCVPRTDRGNLEELASPWKTLLLPLLPPLLYV